MDNIIKELNKLHDKLLNFEMEQFETEESYFDSVTSVDIADLIVKLVKLKYIPFATVKAMGVNEAKKKFKYEEIDELNIDFSNAPNLAQKRDKKRYVVKDKDGNMYVFFDEKEAKEFKITQEKENICPNCNGNKTSLQNVCSDCFHDGKSSLARKRDKQIFMSVDEWTEGFADKPFDRLFMNGIEPGLYKLYWKTGGHSLAAIDIGQDNKYWVFIVMGLGIIKQNVPCDRLEKYWDNVKFIERI